MLATILGVLGIAPVVVGVVVLAGLIVASCAGNDSDEDEGAKAKDTPLRPGTKGEAETKPSAEEPKKADGAPGKSEILPLIPNLNCCSVDEEVAGVDVCDANEVEDVYGRTTYEFANSDGKYAGLFHDSMRSVALLASDIETGDLEDWYVVRPQDSTAENVGGGILSDSNVIHRKVSFGNICHVDTFWTVSNATRPVVSAGPEGTVNLDFDGGEGLSDSTEQTMIYSAFSALGAEDWNAYKMAYFGFPFAQMQEAFRDDEIIESGYRDVLKERLAETEIKDTGDVRADGILSLVYSFAPTKVDPENSEFPEAQWVKDNLTHMGSATGQDKFAQALIAGYSLHKAEDALKALIANKDSLDPDQFDAKKRAIVEDLAAVNAMIGSSDRMASEIFKEMEAMESNIHPLKPANPPKVRKEDLENEYQKPFITVMQDRAFKIYKELKALSAPEKVEEKPKKSKPKPKPEPKPKPKPKPEPKPEPKPKPKIPGLQAPVAGSKS